MSYITAIIAVTGAIATWSRLLRRDEDGRLPDIGPEAMAEEAEHALDALTQAQQALRSADSRIAELDAVLQGMPSAADLANYRRATADLATARGQVSALTTQLAAAQANSIPNLGPLTQALVDLVPVIQGIAAHTSTTAAPASSRPRRTIDLPAAFDGSTRTDWRAFHARLMACISTDWEVYAAVGALHAVFLTVFAGPVLDWYTADPLAILSTAYTDRAAVVAAARSVVDHVANMFAASTTELRRAAEKEYASLWQGDLDFGAFYAKFITAAMTAERVTRASMPSPTNPRNDLLFDLRRKTRRELVRALDISNAGVELPWEEFVAHARRMDGIVERPAKPAKVKAAPFVERKPTAILTGNNVKWTWDPAVPANLRGTLTSIPRGQDGGNATTRELLAAQGRCFYCRLVGHVSNACPEKSRVLVGRPQPVPAQAAPAQTPEDPAESHGE